MFVRKKIKNRCAYLKKRSSKFKTDIISGEQLLSPEIFVQIAEIFIVWYNNFFQGTRIVGAFFTLLKIYSILFLNAGVEKVYLTILQIRIKLFSKQ